MRFTNVVYNNNNNNNNNNNIDTSGIRVDVASKEIAEFRSFRMLAPDELREILLQPHLWPEGVRVKDYVVYKKSYKSMSKSKYQH